MYLQPVYPRRKLISDGMNEKLRDLKLSGKMDKQNFTEHT